MYLVEYKKDISELEQVWWGAEALSLWGEAEGAEHVQPGERLLCGDHNAVLNYLMERNREKVDGVLEEEWEVMDMSWKTANIAEKISPWVWSDSGISFQRAWGFSTLWDIQNSTGEVHEEPAIREPDLSNGFGLDKGPSNLCNSVMVTCGLL